MNTRPPRVTIRQAEADDAAALKAIYEQEHAYADTLLLPYPSVSLWEERLDEAQPDFQNLVACAGDQVVGHLGLEVFETPRRKHAATFGIAVDKGWLRKGVGGRLMVAAIDLADNWLNIKRLELEVYVNNKPAIALYKKFGFSIEGECKCYAFRAGDYVDIYRMARLRPDD
jgi:putative acetyltransferase